MSETKKTPEELKQMRVENLKKAREAKKANDSPAQEALQPKLDTIEVPKSFIDDLQAQMKELKEKQGMLEQIADKKQLANFFARNQKKLPKNVSLRMWNNKVIVGWDEMTENTVDTNPLTGAPVVKQSVKIIDEDKTITDLPYLTWARGFKRTNAVVVSSTTDENSGRDILKVQRKDNGKIYDISVLYVN